MYLDNFNLIFHSFSCCDFLWSSFPSKHYVLHNEVCVTATANCLYFKMLVFVLRFNSLDLNHLYLMTFWVFRPSIQRMASAEIQRRRQINRISFCVDRLLCDDPTRFASEYRPVWDSITSSACLWPASSNARYTQTHTCTHSTLSYSYCGNHTFSRIQIHFSNSFIVPVITLQCFPYFSLLIACKCWRQANTYITPFR